MQEDLAKLYETLKNGYYRGIDITPVFEGSDFNYVKQLHNRAINDGFAKVPSVTSYTTLKELYLELTEEGRKYSTHQAFCERHRKSDFAISNSVVGNHNSGVVQGRDLNTLSPTINAAPQQAQPKQNPINKSGQDKGERIKMAGIIITLVSAIIGLITKLMDLW